jgi:hypothetical protein
VSFSTRHTYFTPVNSYGASTSNGWIDEDLRRMARAISELQQEVSRMDQDMLEMQDFVKYVDETAPELRTAYQVSKRME